MRAEETTNTLATLIARRQREREIAETNRQRELDAYHARERQESLENMARWIELHIAPELIEALAIQPAYDETAAGDEEAVPHYASLTVNGDVWAIRNLPIHYGHHWTLCGPSEYRAIVDPHYLRDDISGDLLDAIAAYPDWLAKSAEREAEREREAARQQEERERARQNRRQRVFGLRGEACAVLTEGAEITLRALDPLEENGVYTITVTLDDVSANWLLVTASAGRQLVIPTRQIVWIEPR